MAKVKHTKTELKAQKDALSRFQKFLPMLQLKKQQLQAEIVAIRAKVEVIREAIREGEAAMEPWLALLADEGAPIPVVSEGVVTETGNIAGVAIPIFKGVKVRRVDVDLFATPAWIDDAAAACGALFASLSEITVLQEQCRLIEEELRTTAQRVNLFEKVKIPECKENIRVIRIHIGDEQTSAVARGKIAKGRDTTGGNDPIEEVA